MLGQAKERGLSTKLPLVIVNPVAMPEEGFNEYDVRLDLGEIAEVYHVPALKKIGYYSYFKADDPQLTVNGFPSKKAFLRGNVTPVVGEIRTIFAPYWWDDLAIVYRGPLQDFEISVVRFYRPDDQLTLNLVVEANDKITLDKIIRESAA